MKDINNGKITTRQAIIISVLSVASPLITLIPVMISESAKNASIIAPLVTLLFYLVLVYILFLLFKNNEKMSLEDIFKLVLGNFIGKILIFLYIVWTFMLLSLYVRAFGERFVSTIEISSPIQFFIAVMLGLGFLVARGKIEHFARSSEVFTLILLIAFLGAFILILPRIDLENFYPITTNDIIPISYASYQISSVAIYIMIVFFLGDQIVDKKNIKKYGIQSGIFLTIVTSISVIMTVGVFGGELTSKFPLPFFMALKEVNLFGKISGLESIFISFWLISDFVVIALLLYVINKLVNNLFSLKTSKETITPIVFGTFIFSLLFVDNSAEIIEYTKNVETHITAIFGFILPVLVLIIGKLRKKI